MTMAPIVLFVYNRPWHTQQTIESLQKNVFAEQSDLVIFSDAAKDVNSQSLVQKVREYIKDIGGFKSVRIVEREQNWGLAKSVIAGVTDVITQYGRIIVLEDDIVTNTNFLRFMNQSLEYYHSNNRIMSISGYSHPFKIPKNYKKDTLLFYRSSSWGWATWSDRWKKVDFEMSDYQSFIKNKDEQERFNYGGEDLLDMLQYQMSGKINSWAIRFAYAQYRYDSYSVFPIHSLTKNIGHDGTGTHCGISNEWDVELVNEWTPKIEDIELNSEIVSNLQEVFKLSLKSKLKRFIKLKIHRKGK